ncbi:MliC family protein [Deinococcus sp. Marseille-Q6407]|uniref:MliC family protein n=1 Tax=Deinococcus sp. Marseille-Q6407 TaxID=2969223 RepID=UPI0021C03EC3|nr:MliC family protein [Deinococcus sp. Marseille-Q6407]
MKKAVMLMSVLVAATGSAFAGGGAVPATKAPQPTVTSHRYACANAQSVQVRYVDTDPVLKRDPVLAIVNYHGQSYGLAPAVSASGSRFVGLAGLNTASGLEWWEHQGEGTLSTYNPANGQTKTLVSGCRIQR